jgi:bifunctional non-homologous end joining protein LigD
MKPMLADSVEISAVGSYVRDPGWVAQQKLDGDRLLIHVADGKVEALNRAGELRRNAVPKRVLAEFSQMTKGHWWFDGELLGDELWVFDLPAAMGRVSPEHELRYRLEVLTMFHESWAPKTVRLLPTAWDLADKEQLVEQVHNAGGEGVMIKDLGASYRQGKRSPRMLKAKFTHTVDVVVDQVSIDGKSNCSLVLFDNGQPVPVGSCSTLGKPPVSVGSVLEVKYLYASDDRRLYQPRILRIRTDKPATECDINQLHFTNREVVNINRTEERT